jgi:hypothetical protein
VAQEVHGTDAPAPPKAAGQAVADVH